VKKWGLVVTLFYGVVVLAFLVPGYMLIAASSTPSAADIKGVYAEALPWICAGVVMLGAILLLWLSADTTSRRLKPRTHILISALTTGLFLAILTIAITLAICLGVWGEGLFNFLPDSHQLAVIVGAFVVPWLVWGILFYRLCRKATDPMTRALAWMFRGSVLELLIAVPAHVIMRRRHDCSAPVVVALGSPPASRSCCSRLVPACCSFSKNAWKVIRRSRPRKSETVSAFRSQWILIYR
jgi:hypothetical protein